MRVAITGGTGFIGRPLVERLAASGHEVTVLTRHPGAVSGFPAGVRAAPYDTTRPIPRESLQGAEAVVHLAGENISAKRWSGAVKKEIATSRLQGTATLVRAIREAGTVRTFISASAVGYYGDRGAEPLTEVSPPGSDFLATLCRDWEAAAHGTGARTVIARIGIVLHPEGGLLAKMITPFKLGVGGKLGSGTQYVSWVHRTDVVRLLEHLLSTETLDGAVNVTAPEPVTNEELTRALGRALHRPTVMAVPGFALRLAMGEMAEYALGGQRVLPARAAESGFSFQFPRIDDALADLIVKKR